MAMRIGGLALLAWGAATAGWAQTPPKLVNAYAEQLVGMCRASAGSPSVQAALLRADLNADGRLDWIVDAGRYPCPGRPAVAVQAGAPVTVFLATEDGGAAPAFQRLAQAAQLQRAASGEMRLWLTLGGGDCGEADLAARCERRLTWLPDSRRFELQAPTTAQRP